MPKMLKRKKGAGGEAYGTTQAFVDLDLFVDAITNLAQDIKDLAQDNAGMRKRLVTRLRDQLKEAHSQLKAAQVATREARLSTARAVKAAVDAAKRRHRRLTGRQCTLLWETLQRLEAEGDHAMAGHLQAAFAVELSPFDAISLDGITVENKQDASR